MPDINDDVLSFDDELERAGTSTETWPILIVDDEEQVHQATRYALGGYAILGRKLEFVSVYSAREARECLQEGREFACILLDVVMESHDAGLELVSFIRETIADLRVRIVLRTGQPGYAPEVSVIQKYDINDYKCKSELTRNRLITTLTAALRSYQQICTIEANRRGLELIIGAASKLFAIRAVTQFTKGVLLQICSMLQIPTDGILCARYVGDDRADLRILAASGRYADLHGHPLSDINDAAIVEDVRRAMASRNSFFWDDRAVHYIVSARGEELVVHVRTNHPLSELDRKLLEVFSINIAVGFDNAHLFEQVEHLAFNDALTGLPNRVAFEREIERHIRLHAPFTVILADIDDFEAVNDGLGHDVGNLTLIATADLLRRHFGPALLIARVSSDSFGIVVPASDRGELAVLLGEFGRRLETNVRIEDNDIPLAITMGVAFYPDHGDTTNRLFQNAGIALKQAKRACRASYRIFDDRFETDLLARLLTVKQLHYAVERRELILFYQPQIDLASGRVCGVEALLRWQCNGVMVEPDRFIPAAESSGLIVNIGEWVLREACLQQVRWKNAHGLDLQTGVNVSIRQLKDPAFPEMVREILRETAIDPSRLELEVTESIIMDEAQDHIAMLAKVRAMGVRIAIDDFGTGYSSLSYLQRLPVDRLKIDQAFVAGLTEREGDRVIAALIVQMGHLLGMRVIAEGVETPEQEQVVRELKCDEVQGFLYARPVSSERLVETVLCINR